jgi:hypothetical protein
MTEAFDTSKLIDPTTRYPGPPFDTPKQSAPGTVHKLNPPADHGEASYKGHGRLKGRRALVTGGDSGIGRAAAIAFAREGANVVINYLPEEEQDAREVLALLSKEGVVAKGFPGT